MTSFRRRGEKATICLQEHVVIDMYPAPISLATSCGSSPMTPPLAWPPPTSPTTTRMGTISSEPKDPAQVPALRSRPPSCQRTSWTPKATRGRLQTADLRPPVAPAAPGQKGPPSSRTEPRAPWSTQAPESLGQGKVSRRSATFSRPGGCLSGTARTGWQTEVGRGRSPPRNQFVGWGWDGRPLPNPTSASPAVASAVSLRKPASNPSLARDVDVLLRIFQGPSPGQQGCLRLAWACRLRGWTFPSIKRATAS
ncbi:uncharacterized protein C10orf95-like isoform X1 [Piliocolobus tephrosceles]|uniref:uncharacterized protein C10orf95-like isoform X1 n=1 Tax=Piliocolobus tephrosceles TaxID=591936 RepID=UPI000E6B292F|nr:uncharacterized protein C10orf95-like isoform X1 [Piliocolobus tephrosceles]